MIKVVKSSRNNGRFLLATIYVTIYGPVRLVCSIIITSYQCRPGYEERRNDKAIDTVNQFARKEDDPLVEEEVVKTNGG